MYEISDLMQGFTFSQVINYIVIVYVRNYHNMMKKYCFEALNEKKKIEALHEMLSVCAPLVAVI